MRVCTNCGCRTGRGAQAETIRLEKPLKLPNLTELLEIENTPTILSFRCPRTQALLWPLIRNQFLRQLISDLYYRQAPLVVPRAAVPKGRALGALVRTVGHNVRQGRMRGDVLVMRSGAGHFLRDGRWFNRITDYFVSGSPADTVTVEGVVDWHLPQPHWNPRVLYWLPWQTAITLSGHLLQRDRHTTVALDLLEFVRQRAADLLGLRLGQPSMNMLISMLARKLARLPTEHNAYRRLLEKVCPRLVLLDQACYGHFSSFNTIAREMEIRVAEPQHGMVSAGHDAYRYAPLLCESHAYRNCLPHDFLGYGSWWNQQVNAPVRKWEIGNPHYIEQRRNISNPGICQKDILLLGDGVEFDLYLGLATQLTRLLSDDYRVVLRPHPLERASALERYPEGRAGRVHIDTSRDIYSSFVGAHVVAGEVSTGLFEALGVAGRVFLWDTEKARFAYPSHPFSKFVDASDFVSVLHGVGEQRAQIAESEIWAENWEDNYRSYLTHVLN